MATYRVPFVRKDKSRHCLFRRKTVWQQSMLPYKLCSRTSTANTALTNCSMKPSNRSRIKVFVHFLFSLYAPYATHNHISSLSQSCTTCFYFSSHLRGSVFDTCLGSYWPSLLLLLLMRPTISCVRCHFVSLDLFPIKKIVSRFFSLVCSFRLWGSEVYSDGVLRFA